MQSDKQAVALTTRKHKAAASPAAPKSRRRSPYLLAAATTIAVMLAQTPTAHAAPAGDSPDQASPPQLTSGTTAPSPKLGKKFTLNIPAQSISSALTDLGAQTGLTIIVETKVSQGVKSDALRGTYTADEALKKLLEPAGLRADYLDSKTVAIRPIKAVENATKPISSSSNSSANVLRVAQNTADATPDPQDGASKNSANPDQDSAAHLDEIVVTGTHIAGAPSASPMLVISQEQMIEAGQANLGDVIRSIPQNFSGGQNPAVFNNSANISNQNVTGGSALNLRGLGPDATLTLLNGHRLSYDGFTQAVDISMIPLAALERIEIVADGASAIYGSDAVGGVANVILKPDYTGVSVSARAGSATDGGDLQQQYGLVTGTTWSTGGVIAALDSDNETAINSSQRSFAGDMFPTSLLPTHDSLAVLLGAHQDLGSLATFKVDALFQHRTTDALRSGGTSIYKLDTLSKNFEVAPSLSFKLPGSWSLELDGLYGNDHSLYDLASYTNGGVRTYLSSQCYCNSVSSVEADADGAVLRLPAGEVRVALGGGYRRNSFDNNWYTSAYDLQGRRHSDYEFSEVFVPVVSPEQVIPWVTRLSVSAAARRENYSDLGDVTTPKIGLIYAPVPAVDLKASWGKSFKASTLVQEYQGRSVYLDDATFYGPNSYPPTATTMEVDGGNRDLKPERATTWTVTLALHPQNLRAFTADVSYFHIDYTNRILAPISNDAAALSNPSYQDFITYSPSVAQQQAAIASTPGGLTNYASSPYNPANVVALVNNYYVNVASQRIRGVDLSSSYRLDWELSSLTFSEQASWLHSEQQDSALAPSITLAGTIFNPPHLHSRFGATWDLKSLVLAGFYNYIGPVTDIQSSPHVEGRAMQTLDLTAIYHFRAAEGVLRNFDLVASVLNVTNQAPPYLKSYYGQSFPNYDTTNYSPVGRFVSLGLAKHW